MKKMINFVTHKNKFILIVLLATIPLYYKITLDARERVELNMALEMNRNHPYLFDATRSSLSVIGYAMGSKPSNWGQSMALLLSPVALLMLPSNLLADTLFLPYDAYLWHRDSKHIKFWMKVSKEEITSLPSSKYLAHYTDAISPLLSRWAWSLNDEKILKIYFEVASAHGEFKLSRQIIERATEHGKRFPELGKYMCAEAAKDINSHKFSRSIYLMLGRHQYPRQCATMLAEAGVECQSLLYNKHLPEKYIRQCWQNEKTWGLAQILAKNSAAPADLHEKIYEDSFNSEVPGYQTQIIKDLARHTISMKLIIKIYELNRPDLDTALFYNHAIPDDIKQLTRAREKAN